MALYLSEDQAMLKDTVAPFLAENAPVKHLRSLRDSKDPVGLSKDLWKQFAEMGFTGILVPEADGGLGMGHVEAGIVLEEIGRNLTPSPFLSTSVVAVEALKAADKAMRDALVSPVSLPAKRVIGIAIEEGAKHHPEKLR
jgi:alkylation response protein AidB-like acyl-CoA dehydrogenase